MTRMIVLGFIHSGKNMEILIGNKTDFDIFIETINGYANLPTEGTTGVTLPIQRHSGGDEWFIFRTYGEGDREKNFIESVGASNGGVAQVTALIEEYIEDEKFTLEDKTWAQLYDEGWLPSPPE